MKDISLFITYFEHQYRKKCKSWDKAVGACSSPDGCICSKFSEVNAHIRSLVPEAYRSKTIYAFDGRLPSGEEVVAAEDVERIQDNLWKYLYGDKPFVDNKDRKELNAMSVLDRRFTNGDCLVIHGDQRSFSRGSHNMLPVQRKTQTGKTLLASIAIIDACWRRCFNSNRAMTYDWISFLTMRPLLKTRFEEHPDIEAARESDWLIIDDINLISSEQGDRGANWTREAFDGFLMDRVSNNRPTILICNFDIDKHSLSSNMGDAFDKIAHSAGTTVVKVEGVKPGKA